ncbi:hypothetical protein [Phytohabitans houttuyneae]|nr:hypothetical protein [Phytohabitans houttuyneae]
MRYAGNDHGFAAWLLVADTLALRHPGVSILDLSDWNWREAYDRGETPGSALRQAMACNDTFGLWPGRDT